MQPLLQLLPQLTQPPPLLQPLMQQPLVMPTLLQLQPLLPPQQRELLPVMPPPPQREREERQVHLLLAKVAILVAVKDQARVEEQTLAGVQVRAEQVPAKVMGVHLVMVVAVFA